MNFAVVGRNFVADWFIEASRCFDELCLYGVYSRSQSTAGEYAAKHGAKKTFTSLDDLCSDKNIDFVYIASPNICHEEQTTALLNSGKHVLVEKPAAPSADAFARMQKVAGKSGCVMMEAMMPAHMPATATLRSLLGEIGPVRRATLSYCQYSSRYDKYKNGIVENAFNPALCNGALMDIGVYCVHMAVMLFGTPETVAGGCMFLPRSIDGEGTLVLGYPDIIADIVYSKISDSVLPSQIQGEKGCILIDSMSRPKNLTLVMRDGSRREINSPAGRPDMYYELFDFIGQIKGVLEPRFNTYTYETLGITDKARGLMNIDFNKNNRR
jgi:predicted dehydrogenase